MVVVFDDVDTMPAEFVDVVDDLVLELVGRGVLGLCHGALRPALLRARHPLITDGRRRSRTIKESQNFVLEPPMILLEHQRVPSIWQEDQLFVIGFDLCEKW
jgi:hypothetical protein